jgi:hypothetical protein
MHPGGFPSSAGSFKLIFYHPDYTVGLGVAPSQSPCCQSAQRVAGFAFPLLMQGIAFTAGQEFHPAPKILIPLIF